MADYLAVTESRTLTPAGQMVVSKHFVPRSEAETSDPLRSGVSVKSYGAVGDGVTNDHAAVQAALDAAAKGNVLIFPAGVYYLGSRPLAVTLAGVLSIQGYGTAALLWDSGDGLRLSQDNALHTITIEGITLRTRAPGTGVALEIIGTKQNATGANLRPRNLNRGSLSKVNISGNSSIYTDGWAKGIRLVDIMNFFIDDVHIDGCGGPRTGTGAYISTHGVEMITNPLNAQAVDVAISKLWVFFVKYALDVQGYEGVLVDQSSFIAVENGFRFDAVDGGTPLATFTNSQVAFIHKGLEWTKMNQGLISGSLIYIHPGGGNPEGVGVTLHDTTTTRVTDNTFVSNVGMRTGVAITGTSLLNVVEACTFYSTIVNPVNLGTATFKNTVQNLNLGTDPARQPVIDQTKAGVNTVEGVVEGFYGKAPVVRPTLPASPSVLDLTEALKALGLVSQA